jgi:hypothetical protein
MLGPSLTFIWKGNRIFLSVNTVEYPISGEIWLNSNNYTVTCHHFIYGIFS